jgi:hypothetical protein
MVRKCLLRSQLKEMMKNDNIEPVPKKAAEDDGSDGKNLMVIECITTAKKKEIKTTRKRTAINAIGDNNETSNKEIKKEVDEKQVVHIVILMYSWENGRGKCLKQAIQNIAETKKAQLFLTQDAFGDKDIAQFLKKEELEFEMLHHRSSVPDTVNKFDGVIVLLSENTKRSAHYAIMEAGRAKKSVEIIVDSRLPLRCRDCSKYVLEIDGKIWKEQFPLYHCLFCSFCCISRREHKKAVVEYKDKTNSRMIVDDDGDAFGVYPLPKSISHLDCSNCKTDRYCDRYYKVVHLLNKTSDVETGFEIMCSECVKKVTGDEESDSKSIDDEDEEEEMSD